MQVEMHENKTHLFAPIQVSFWHIARKDRLDAIIAKLEYFSGLRIEDTYEGHLLSAYFDNELYAENAIEDVKILSPVESELRHGRFDVTSLIAR